MKVSVVIPCFNVEEFIEECVESVLKQTYHPIEIICVDNNSSDKTWEVLERIQIANSKITIVKELKAGACAARNKGLSLSNGEWIQFLDADDLLLPDKIEHQVGLIKASAISNSFITAAFTVLHTSGLKQNSLPHADNYYQSVFINKAGITSCNLWNRESLLAVSGWNEELNSSQEADLMMRLVLNGGIPLSDMTPKTIIRLRESGQITQGNPARRWKQYIEIRLEYLAKLKDLKPTIYSDNLGLYQDFLMISIATLYKYDRSQANKFFYNNVKPNWQTHSKFGMSKFKMLLIKLFGLKIVAK